ITVIFKIRNIITLLVLLTLIGCSSISTSTEHYKEIDKFVNQELFGDAVVTLQKNQQESYDEKDRVLFWIDLGLLQHYAYQDSLSISNLMLADYAIEELYTTSISKGVASMVLNDNALDYSGEDYENLYINVFKALAFYREGKSESALVEIRRLTEKFVELEQKYQQEFSPLKESDEIKTDFEEIPVNFYSSALAHYISMILFLNDGEYDDARISRDKFYDAFDNQKELYGFPKPKLENFLSQSDKAKLSFITFTGRAPLKYEYVFQIDTYKNLIVISILENGRWTKLNTIPWYGVDGGIHAKFAVPKLIKRGSIVQNVQVYVDGMHKKNLYKIESLEDIAFETFKREEGIIYLKSLARTVSKAIANEALNKEIDKQSDGDWGGLTRLLTGALINATENADLRIAHYFPSFAYGGEIEVQPGVHTIEIVYKDRYNKTIATDIFENYNVSKNKKIDLLETVFLQ
ncbi:MAG: hypothetical protein KAI45_09850, partial [Melioribacteraceae bacterium]|nr:hypothetical protein [Melioribacteraceae bacterium]